MKLVNDNGQEVKIGDEVTTFRGDKGRLDGMDPPKHAGSTGRIYVKINGSNFARVVFPAVCDLKWEE